MTFTIHQVYKAVSPRGQFYKGPVTEWSTSGTTTVTVSPATTPEGWALSINSLRLLESSLSTSGTGTGIIQIEYPDYTGTMTNTFTVNSVTALKHLADEVVQHNSATYYVMRFDPPILLKESNTVSSLTLSLPTNVSLDSGSLGFNYTGWTIKESDYD